MADCPSKKRRQARRTSEQLCYMVDYFIQHPHVLTGKFQALHGRSDLEADWNQLVHELNAMSKDGKIKDKKSWQATCRDEKAKVSKKVALLRADRAATGNLPVQASNLNEYEKKILGLIGFDCVEGAADCPDTFPEEQFEAIQLLADGEEGILQIPPTPLTVRDSVGVTEPPASTLPSATETFIFDINQIEIEDEHINNVEETPENHSLEYHSSDKPMTEPTTSRTLPTIPYTSRSAASTTGKNSANSKTSAGRESVIKRKKCVSRERLGVQLQDARETFAGFASRNEQNMEMLARAAQQQAEATARMADAITALAQAMAESERSRNAVLTSLGTVLERLADRLPRPQYEE